MRCVWTFCVLYFCESCESRASFNFYFLKLLEYTVEWPGTMDWLKWDRSAYLTGFSWTHRLMFRQAITTASNAVLRVCYAEVKLQLIATQWQLFHFCLLPFAPNSNINRWFYLFVAMCLIVSDFVSFRLTVVRLNRGSCHMFVVDNQ